EPVELPKQAPPFQAGSVLLLATSTTRRGSVRRCCNRNGPAPLQSAQDRGLVDHQELRGVGCMQVSASRTSPGEVIGWFCVAGVAGAGARRRRSATSRPSGKAT